MVVNPRFQRLSILTGIEAANAIANAKVVVVGLGGVGSWCVEALARSGVKALTLIDSDLVCVSNINRQIQALDRTVGQGKALALAERIKEINPDCKVTSLNKTFSRQGSFEETAKIFGIDDADYVIDAIDSIDCKLDLIETAASKGKKLFSSMGMARKTDPVKIRTADIWKTSCCPLAKKVRLGLKERGFDGHFIAVYSEEQMQTGQGLPESRLPDEKIIGSIVTVTATAGMILANLVIKDICSRFAKNAADKQ